MFESRPNWIYLNYLKKKKKFAITRSDSASIFSSSCSCWSKFSFGVLFSYSMDTCPFIHSWCLPELDWVFILIKGYGCKLFPDCLSRKTLSVMTKYQYQSPCTVVGWHYTLLSFAFFYSILKNILIEIKFISHTSMVHLWGLSWEEAIIINSLWCSSVITRQLKHSRTLM